MKKLNVTINFDMDGTIADLFGVEGWLTQLENHDETPYAIAEPLLPLNILARMLNNLQGKGYKIAVISWLAGGSDEEYDLAVTEAKLDWLAEHMPSVVWDAIDIVPYGTPKNDFCMTPNDILFDDCEQNREDWEGVAFDVNEIIEILKELD
jgi:hypothetical protein